MSGEFAIEIPDVGQTQADMTLAKNCGDTLLKHYPNHLWAVNVAKGIISVKNMSLSGTWGFIIKTGEIFSATQLDKLLMRAGGEILERYKMTRTPLNGGRTADKLLALPTDFAGRLSPEK